jgi:hypothetical protein
LRLASRGFLYIFGKERHEKSAAAKERNERAAELPIAETVVISSRVRRRKVWKIESQPWHIKSHAIIRRGSLFRTPAI